MVPDVDTVGMFALFFLIGLLAVCVLAAFYGADSRYDEPGRHHPTLL